jgi:hypothetical protein
MGVDLARHHVELNTQSLNLVRCLGCQLDDLHGVSGAQGSAALGPIRLNKGAQS